MAVCNVKAGNVVQAMGKTQIEVIDTWSFFQAKSTKQSLAEAAVDQLSLQRETSQLTPEQSATLDKRLASYREKVTRYEGEKADLKKKVDELEKDYERLNVKDDQFDISESLLSVAIAMLGITALTQKRKLLFVAMGFAGFGLVVGLSGFFGWNLRPEWLAKIIGA
jgi:predicted  nucleic acid-binding Zn-ribbon protein